jgi:hypothetical protein
MSNKLIKNILSPKNHKYVWNIINKYSSLSEHTSLPNNEKYENTDNFMITILKKISENIVYTCVLYNYNNIIASKYNNIIFHKNIILKINGKKQVFYKLSLIHHYATEKIYKTNIENKSVVNAIINKTINKSIVSNNDCSFIISNQKLIRNPETNDVIEPILELKQYIIFIIPDQFKKYEKNIYSYNDILNHNKNQDDNIKKEKIEKINKKIYELYTDKMDNFLFSEYLNYENFITKFVSDEFNIKLFIINGNIEDMMILTTDGTPIIIIQTTNIINYNEWFFNKTTCVINNQMNNFQLINNYKNTIINVFNVYLHNLYPKKINNDDFALIIY